MRVVLDTAVVVAAMRSPRGASAELIRQVDGGRATAIVSVALALEYEAICMLAEHRLPAGLSAEDATAFVDGLIAMSEPVLTFFRWRPQLSDPGDELVLEAAVNGRADAVVTFNERDLLPAKQRFGIEVILPREALRRIKR
jgi:putative PIN family toxin of toxin-antitoxin system